MLDHCAAQHISLGGDEASIRYLSAGGNFLPAAHILRVGMGGDKLCLFTGKLSRAPNLAPAPPHNPLRGMNLAAILPANSEKGIESAFPAATACHTQQD